MYSIMESNVNIIVNKFRLNCNNFYSENEFINLCK